MSEEKEVIQTNETSDKKVDDNYLLNTIKKLKETTVSREEYEKLESTNKFLVENFVNGQPAPKEENEVVATEKELNDIRKELFNPECELTNLEFAAKALFLRNELIKKGENDPFIPHSTTRNPTPENIETANRVAEVLAECIKAADGSPEIFTAELMRRTK